MSIIGSDVREIPLVRGGALMAVLAPLCLMAGALLLPASDTVPAEYLAALAAHPARADASTLLSFVGFVLLVPGVAVLGVLASSRAGTSGTVAAVPAVLGAAAFPATVATNAYDVRIAVLLGPDPALDVYDGVAGSAAGLLPVLLAVVGLGLGLLLLGLALARARVVPWWVPAALLAGLVILNAARDPQVAALGFLPVAAALARCAVVVLRRTDDPVRGREADRPA